MIPHAATNWWRQNTCPHDFNEVTRAQENSNLMVILPSVVFSITNAILLRLLTHHIFKTSPFRRVSWSKIAQQQFIYTICLFVATILYDSVVRGLEFTIQKYYIKLCALYPAPWYYNYFLFSTCADLSSLPYFLTFILKPMTLYVTLQWLVALIPTSILFYHLTVTARSNDTGGPGQFMIWDRAHLWARTELGRAGAYFLGRPVPQYPSTHDSTNNRFRDRKILKTQSLAQTSNIIRISRSKSL